MVSWAIASIRRSILFDVLNVTDRAHKPYADSMLDEELSLLKPGSRSDIRSIYKNALIYDNALSPLFHIPDIVDNIYNYTVMMLVFRSRAFRLHSFDEFRSYIQSGDMDGIRTEILMYFIRPYIPEHAADIDSFIFETALDPVKYLNSMDISPDAKFGLSFMFTDFDMFRDMLVKYFTRIYDAVSALYDLHGEAYIYYYRILRDHLRSCEELPFIFEYTRAELGDMRRKYIYVPEMVCFTHNRVYSEDETVICADGLYKIQKELNGGASAPF